MFLWRLRTVDRVMARLMVDGRIPDIIQRLQILRDAPQTWPLPIGVPELSSMLVFMQQYRSQMNALPPAPSIPALPPGDHPAEATIRCLLRNSGVKAGNIRHVHLRELRRIVRYMEDLYWAVQYLRVRAGLDV